MSHPHLPLTRECLLYVCPADWLPQRGGDDMPAEVHEMVSYARDQNVSLLAYVYPVLPFVADGAEPRNGDGWLYDGRRGKHGEYVPNFNTNTNVKLRVPNW